MWLIMPFTYRFLLPFVVSAVIAQFAAAQLSEDQKLEIESLHEAHVANVESIVSMDVSFTHERVRFSEEISAVEEIVIRQRLLKDEEEKVGVFATVYELKGFREKSIDQPGRKAISVVVQLDNRIASRRYPKPVDWLGVTDTTNFSTASDHPDFRFLGRYPFPMSTSSMPESTLQNVLRHGGSYRDGMRLSVLPEMKAAVVYPFPGAGRDVKSQRIFDLRTSLIVGVRSNSRSKDGNISPRLVERYKWKEVDGIYVPVFIGGERRTTEKNASGKRISWNNQYDVQLEWHSVNKPIESDVSYESFLEDPNKVLEFVDAENVEVVAGPIEKEGK